MNQGIAFARTLRGLDADDFRGSKLGLAIAVILLGAWIWWMLAARIPQYEQARSVRMEQGHAIAYFPSTSEIHAGQAASVVVGGVAIPALVESVISDRAIIAFTNNQQPTTPSTPTAASVEVSRLSPASIALRALDRGR